MFDVELVLLMYKKAFLQFGLVLAILCSPCIGAEIIGDGIASNGIEDGRQRLSSSQYASVQRFVGTIECAGRTRGTGVLLREASTEGEPERPLLLTAKHTLIDPTLEETARCEYRPMGTSWEAQVIPQSSRISLDPVAEIGTSILSRVEEYNQDWAIIAIEPWPTWEGYALPYRSRLERPVQEKMDFTGKAVLIGYDAATGSIMIDPNCRYGLPSEESLLAGAAGLVWDDCDSVPGSSGGALFSIKPSGLRFVGIRLGNLFDSQQYPLGPDAGEKFDLNKNLNVTRVFDSSIRQRLLAQRVLERPAGAQRADNSHTIHSEL